MQGAWAANGSAGGQEESAKPSRSSPMLAIDNAWVAMGYGFFSCLIEIALLLEFKILLWHSRSSIACLVWDSDCVVHKKKTWIMTPGKCVSCFSLNCSSTPGASNGSQVVSLLLYGHSLPHGWRTRSPLTSLKSEN